MRAQVLALALALPLALAASPARAADAKPKLAILDFTANGASKELASAAGGVAASELDRLGVFRIVTTDAIRDLLALEKQKQMLGCADSASCVAEIGGALGVDYLVSGKVTRLAAGKDAAESFSLELTLSSVKKAQREATVVESGRSEADLISKVGRTAQRLVAKILQGRSGGLVVTASESGAAIRIDDQVRGTTPLGGQLSLPAGPHALSVEKQGFVTYQKDVQVQPGQLTEERVTLVPSPDFIREYESRQKKLRLGAWISTGVAVLGLAGATYFAVDANKKYGNESTPGTFLYARSKVNQKILVDPVTGTDYVSQANSLKSDIQQAEKLTWVCAGVGATAAVAATWFWIAGEPPDRYARYREGSARLDVAPLPGGALAAVRVGF
jgi:hypothetical protein